MLHKNFNLNINLQRKIASGYLVDGRDWLMILNSMKESDFDPDSYMAKKFSLLIFSFECSLKSIFISLSNKRNCILEIYDDKVMTSHKISEIYPKCQILSKGRYRILSKSFEEHIAKIDGLGMKLRYSNDYFNVRKNEPMIEKVTRNGPSFSITKEEFISQCLDQATNLNKKATQIHANRFKGHEVTPANKIGIIDEWVSYVVMRPKQRKNVVKPSLE